MQSFRAKSRLQRSPESFRSEARLSIPLHYFTVNPPKPSTPLPSAQDDAGSTVQRFNVAKPAFMVKMHIFVS
ncbi:MAG: hypothetical protein DME82_02990 [Verrucomicrobia bacterium]|nr:MAG: hypothetical protein DME82_02990 [Verrucomicrobiota bacterium]